MYGIEYIIFLIMKQNIRFKILGILVLAIHDIGIGPKKNILVNLYMKLQKLCRSGFSLFVGRMLAKRHHF